MKAVCVAAALKSSSEALALAGISRPLAEAELILCHVLGSERTALYMNARRPLEKREDRLLRGVLLRRTAGAPLQHLTGKAGFYTCELDIDRRALIPRPDTESLVDVVLDLSARAGPFRRIADVGTGSGNIAIVLARHLPGCAVLATDISAEALALAEKNAVLNGARGRIRFLVAHLLEPLAARSFDLVVANLPYIPDAAWRTLSPEVRDHEPPIALKGGRDGLDLIRELVRRSREVLREDGLLVLEFGDGQEREVRALLEGSGYAGIEVHGDITGRPRVAVGFNGEPARARRPPEEVRGGDPGARGASVPVFD